MRIKRMLMLADVSGCSSISHMNAIMLRRDAAAHDELSSVATFVRRDDDIRLAFLR
jgi:hypothetical protein